MKSIVLKDEQIFAAFGKSPSRQQILTIALHHFVGNEREKSILVQGDDASSFRSGHSGFSVRSERTKFLPHSRLKALESTSTCNSPLSSSKGNLDVRRNSIRRKPEGSPLSSPTQSPQPAIPTLNEGRGNEAASGLPKSQGEEFKAFSKVRASELAKQFTHIDHPTFASTLLAMETTLIPRKMHVDVVKCVAQKPEEVKACKEKNWEAFSQLLGNQIEKGVYLQQNIQSKQSLNFDHDIISPSQKVLKPFVYTHVLLIFILPRYKT